MKKFTLIIAMALCVFHFKVNAQVVRYVKTTASGLADGSSWANASADLQAMINASGVAAQVWVAAGTYKPTTTTNRFASFTMKNDCGIYGGFAGTETLLTQRDFHSNATILSGDIGTPNNNSDNSYHVFNNTSTGLNSTAVLDGFTIRDGNANGSNFDISAGGMLNRNNVSPAISNCIFTANTAVSGGAVYDVNNSNGIFTNCVFASNTATSNAGAGGALIDDNSASVFTNCLFVSNTAPNGLGGAIDAYGSNLTATNCTFYANQASTSGGAFYISSLCNITLKNCIVWGNTAGSNPQYSNLVGSTLTMTYTDIQGGYSGTGNINSDPLFPNTADADGADNIYGTSDDGLKLTALSPAINGGNNSNIPVGITTDITGGSRIQNTTVDMGAYETLVVGSIHYVKTVASGTADGTSWANASADLQAMINASGVADQVWVAAGTYKPTTTTNRNISFSMKNNCAIYGGFAGTETLLSQRDFHTNATILSGDIGTLNNNSDNSYLIVNNDNNGLTTTAVLDGFTIRDANGNGPLSSGGGIYNNHNVSPTISNCIFLSNTSGSGAGIFDGNGSNAVITNCVFAFNTGTFNGACGAAFADAQSSSTLTNCLFVSNTATTGKGGAISAYISNLTATNCTFYGNYANVWAGGLYISIGCNVTLKNSIVWGNTAGSFPQYANNNGSTFNITNSDVQGGYSGTGNINADPQFANIADADGADNMYGTSDDGLFINCTSPALNTGNNTGVAGTDITGNARIQFTTVDMGAYELASLAGVTWYYDNDGDNYYGSTTTSCTSPGAGWSLTTLGADCNDNDVFTHAAITWFQDADGDGYYGATQVSCFQPGAGWYDVSLSGGGDCDDNNAAIHPGAIEISNGIDDNCDGQTDEGFIRYVKTVAIGTGDGSSWANASANLQAMINASVSGGQVWVAAGTYKPTTTTNRSFSFVMKNNCAIYGGFAGTETLLSQRNFHTNATILSGDIGTLNNNSDNSYHVIFNDNNALNSTAVLDGITVRDGNASIFSGDESFGGGMLNYQSSPSISNCIFKNNTAQSGGGVFNNFNSYAVFTNCVFASNTALFGGGAGGAFADANGSSSLTNCLFVSNNATTGAGGAINAFTSNLTATNCTFYGNQASTVGGALYISDLCNVTLKNCIVWSNTASSNPQYFLSSGTALLTMTYSDMQGGYAGTGDINADPQFANTADADGADNIYGTADDGMFISCSSPALNTGNNTGVASTDITGNARIQFTTVDMGAYEVTSLTGVTWYYDGDNDGYYGTTTTACSSPGSGWSLTTLGADCDDNFTSAHQSFLFYADADGDGVGAGSLVSVCAVDANTPPTGYSVSGTDCNDNDNTVWQQTNLFIDNDGDGFATGVAMVCYGATVPAGYSTGTAGPDCDDNNPNVWHLGTFYIDIDADGYDNGTELVCYGVGVPSDYSATTLGSDCDDLNPAVYQTLSGYVDADGDGYTVGGLISVCSGATLPAGYSATSLGTDCSDNDNTVWEMANFYIDADGDGFDGGIAYNICYNGITPPAGYLFETGGSDCDDNNPNVWEGHILYIDVDGDGYTNGTAFVCHGATIPAGYRLFSSGSDCDDNNPNIHPGAIEIPGNGIDENCNGMGDDAIACNISLTGVVNNINCYGSATGSINVSSSNPVGTATYLWNNGATTEDRSNLVAGNYIVTVTYGTGCTLLALFTISQPSNSLIINASKTNIRCGNVSNGIITIAPTGGQPPYNYLWNNGSTNATISNLGIGTYTCTVIDANGCIKMKSVLITGNPSLVTVVNISGNTATANVIGGVPVYSYLWNTTPTQINATATGLLVNHTYKVKVTDSKNCTKLVTVQMPSTRISDVQTKSSISLYPNPTNGIISLNGFNCLNCNCKIDLYDTFGNVVYSKSFNVESTMTLDLSSIAKGVYYLRLNYNGRFEMVKVILQ